MPAEGQRVGRGGGASRQSSTSNDRVLDKLPLKPDRSCIVCHRRKVRCDKKSPCSTCTRTGVLCCYPPGDGRPVTRQPKTTIAEIASRLVQLEKTLVAVAGNSLAKEPATRSSSTEPPVLDEDEPYADDPAEGSSVASVPVGGMLVKNESSSRYINEVLLCRVLEEEREIRTALASPRTLADSTGDRDSDDADAPGFQLLLMLPGAADIALDGSGGLHPPTWQAMELWHIFLRNVDPFTRVLHIPTTQVTVFSAMNNPEPETPAVNSLLFSIYFAAVISLSPNDVRNILGQGKTSALARFRKGLERSLVRSNFSEEPSMATLEALALFLKTARAHYTGRSTWAMYGFALRLAQSIGLHRDGSHFGLSCFETEMRRRLWWQLLASDWRTSIDHGLTISNLSIQSDTRLFTNVNDSALNPNMAEPPTPSAGWTDITFPLLMTEAGYTMQRLWNMLAGFRASGTPPDEERRKEAIAKNQQRVEGLLNACNTVIPIQRVTALMVRMQLRKLEFLTRHQWQSVADGLGNISQTEGSRGVEPARHATKENLADACESLELKLQLQTDEQLHNYRWAGEAYPEYDVATYALWHLCVDPTAGGDGHLVERAWAALDSAFDLEHSRRRRQESAPGAKWDVLVRLRDKAVRIREAVGRAPTTVVAPSQALLGGGDAASDGDGRPLGSIPQDAMVQDATSAEGATSWEGGTLDWEDFINDFTSSGYNV